jgi:hypothetical protein
VSIDLPLAEDWARSSSPPHAESALHEHGCSNYIRYEYHPRARKPARIELLDIDMAIHGRIKAAPLTRDAAAQILAGLPFQHPWAPFRTRADFEVTQLATRLLAKGNDLRDLLRGASQSSLMDNPNIINYEHPYRWQDRSFVTFSSVRDFESTMTHARSYVLGVCLSCFHVNMLLICC